MDTRHLVDPATLPIIDLLPADELNHENLAAIRAESRASFTAMFDTSIEPEARTAPGRDGNPDVPLLLYNPPSSNINRPAILHIHGGGMVMGTVDMSRLAMPALVRANDLVVVSVDYRLAPETPFPGPQEDNYAGLCWLADSAEVLGVDPARIIVMGESAGGGLAASLALMARDRGGPNLAGQVLIYPMLDHRVGGPDDPWRNRQTGEFLWNRARNQFGWEALRGDYSLDDDRIGWFSPARASDLAGLPPTYISTGALDLFLDENLDYARRLVDAGVEVELHVYPGAIHAFDMLPDTRVGDQAKADTRAAIKRLLQI